MTDIVKDLSILERDNYENKQFVPFNELQRLFTQEKVTELLKQSKLLFHLHDEIINRVLYGGLKTFAVLTAIGEIDAISRFVRKDDGIGQPLDARLPLSRSDLDRFVQRPESADLFYRKQWTFLAPVFSFEYSSFRELDDRTILPFLKKKLFAEGGFAKVYIISLDGSHHTFKNKSEKEWLAAPGDVSCESITMEPLNLICKELDRPDPRGTLAKEFEDEYNVLSAIRYLRHPNMVPLYTAYTKGSTYNFLFPVADGDFSGLLKHDVLPSGFSSRSEIIKSLWGLSSALDAFHEYCLPQLDIRRIGCHCDIKPSNILLVDGKLLLSDFGLSRLRRPEDGSQKTFTVGEGICMAPECEDIGGDFRPGKVGRASDVWSFGCVLAQLLVWLKAPHGKGSSAVEEFRKSLERRYGPVKICRFFTDRLINPAVQEVLDKCKESHPAELAALAGIIEKILQPKREHRPRAADITRWLFHLSQYSRITEVKSKLSEFSQPLELELEIEVERMQVWSETVELHRGPLETLNAPWFTTYWSYEKYHHLELLLDNIGKEFGTIASITKEGPPSRPILGVYYRLQQLQTQLWDIQSLESRHLMLNRLEERILSKEGLQSVREASLTIPLAKGDDSYKPYDSSPADRLRRRLIRLATMKGIAEAIAREDLQKHDLRMNPADFKAEDTELGPHGISRLESENRLYLIEYMACENWNERENELLDRVKSIATLRSENIPDSTTPSLQCRGYFVEHSRCRFGLVFRLPPQVQNKSPVNFLTVLEITEDKDSRPSLTQRYQLGTSLVSHILDFHRSNWIHKGISAQNIVFFPDGRETLEINRSLESSYFIGFNHSRPYNDDAFSSLSSPDMEYQHPLYQRNKSRNASSGVRFCQEFDYYSVGMVLLEIGLWKPLHSIVDNIKGSPEQVRAKLLKKHVPRVRVHMGDMYAAAVRYCLAIEVIDGQQPHSPGAIRDDFYRNVVMQISKCVV